MKHLWWGYHRCGRMEVHTVSDESMMVGVGMVKEGRVNWGAEV